MNKWLPSIMPLGAALLLPACIVIDGDRGPLIGTLTVEWTIDGGRDPIDCRDFGVDRLELVISDARGHLVDEVEPWCESFFVAVDLFEGRYFADATLVDSVDRSATLTLPIDAIDIIAGTDLIVSVDFPLGSFL
jgi:hypothetical protein